MLPTDEAIKKAERYLELAKVWTGEGFDQESNAEQAEFWELAKLIPGLHEYIAQVPF